jgi:hypothetical protein
MVIRDDNSPNFERVIDGIFINFPQMMPIYPIGLWAKLISEIFG